MIPGEPATSEMRHYWRCDGRGWPFLAMWSGQREHRHFLRTGDEEKELFNGIALPPVSGTTPWGRGVEVERALPLAIIAPGFVLDSLIYTGAWLTLVMVAGFPRALRRAVRQRRGCCIKCGYDLRGQLPGHPGVGCPECGWRRKREQP
jgi:hypothetical protein